VPDDPALAEEPIFPAIDLASELSPGCMGSPISVAELALLVLMLEFLA
jgi:hypothetical protein